MSSTSLLGRLLNAFKSGESETGEGCSCGMEIEEIESDSVERDGK